MGKADRRNLAREKARVQREAEQARQRRNRWLLQGGLILGLIAVVAVIVLIVTTSKPAPVSEAGPANMLSDGFVVTGANGEVEVRATPAIAPSAQPVPTEYDDDGIAHIVTYLDFGCPACRAFEQTNADTIERLVAAGEATLEVHPVAILDRFFMGGRYSTKSANVAACVADVVPQSFLDVQQALFLNQPAEQTAGLSDDQLVSVVRGAGVENENVEECIRSESFRPWVEAATERTRSNPLPGTDDVVLQGTPTVIVNGKLYDGPITDQAAFAAFVEQASKG